MSGFYVNQNGEWVDGTNSAQMDARVTDLEETTYSKTETDSLLNNKANTSTVTSHTSNTSNPHAVTKSQIGLSNVDNTSDANKPVSTATQTALNGKANISHGHSAVDLSSGTLDIARIPTGTSGTTVAIGNHNHDSRYRNLVTTQAELITAVATGGDIVVDSRVTITLTQQIEITTSCKIIGGNFVRTSGCAFYVTASDVEFRGVKIAGGGGSTYDSTQKLIYVVGSSSALLKNIRVINCEFINSKGDNVWLEWCMDSTVENCYISTFLYSGVMLISCRRCLISGNVIRDSPLTSGVVNVYGIAATDLLNTDAARSRDITIVGNQVSLIDWEGIDTHGGSGINVTGNTVTACPRGIALVTGNASRIIAPVRCVVSGNLVDGAGVRQTIREGIYLGGISGVPADGTVVGNHVTNHSPTFSSSFVSRDKFYIGQNNELFVPWTNITMGAGFTANGTYIPQYSIDGNTVYLRGGVIPKTGGVAANTAIGTIDSAYGWPTQLTFVCFVRGSNTAAGSGYVAVDTSGNITMLYGSGSDSYTYFLNGTYQAA